MRKKELRIGKVYTFDYTSSSKPSNSEKLIAVMNKKVAKQLVTFLKQNAIESTNRFKAMLEMTQDIINAKNLTLKESLKKEFNETFKGEAKEDKPAIINAQNLFFRAYKPENIDFTGEGIKAVFAGWNCTVNGNITYKWYVLSETKIEKKYYSEDFNPFIEIIE